MTLAIEETGEDEDVCWYILSNDKRDSICMDGLTLISSILLVVCFDSGPVTGDKHFLVVC